MKRGRGRYTGGVVTARTLVFAIVLILAAGCAKPDTEALAGSDAPATSSGEDHADHAVDGASTGATSSAGPASSQAADAAALDLELEANLMSGPTPLRVDFVANVTVAFSEVDWEVDFGDGSEMKKGAGLPATFNHTFTAGGTFRVNVTAYPWNDPGTTAHANITIEAVAAAPPPAVPPPDPTTFEFGPSVGCVSDVPICVSYNLGPDASGIDGHWQELDNRYWGYVGTITDGGNVGGDTDCKWMAPDATTVLGDSSNGGGPCAGIVPEGTGWIFVNSWAEPSTGMTLEFTVPTG